MNNIIEISNLHKSYGDVKAVDGLDFYVEKGKIFAFLGPNGAGKSTTIDIICTFLKPDQGEIVVDGFKVGEDDIGIRNIIGAVFQDGLLDKLLTVKENLYIRGGLYGLKGKELKQSVDKTVEITGIKDILKRPYGKLSGGQRRRCDIARALINTPKILFLDEPTTGLDPQTRRLVWEIIIKIQKENDMTVFFTTHYMEEASIADYVIIIDEGKISAKGSPSELKEKYSNDKLILATDNSKSISDILNKLNIEYINVSDTFIIDIESTMDSLPIIQACKDYLVGFEVVKGTMDDAFIQIIGKELRE